MTHDRLELCFERCASRAWRLAVHWLGDSHEAFDVVQQAFVVAAGKPERIPADDPWPWFRQVVINEARNTRRKHKPLPSERENSMPDPRPDPAIAAANSETQRELRRALDDLPEREREALVLTQLNGMTHAEAAATLGIPVKTLSSHVARGLERLKGKLGSKGETMLASVAAAPVITPPGGWEGALASWKAAAFATVTESVSAGSVVATGALLMKKSLVIAGMIAALGIGLGGGALLTHSLQDPPPKTEVSAAKLNDRPLSNDSPLDAPFESPAGEKDNDSAALAAKLSAAKSAETKALKQADDLRDELTAVEGERDVLKDKVTKLETELAPIRAEQASRGPTFTFGKYGTHEGIVDSNWKELAGASHKVVTALWQIREKQVAGEPVPNELYLTLQENTETMRKYEYKTIGQIFTWAKHNGELTHPISHSNLIAGELKLADMPLSEAQVSEIEKLGLQWESDFAAAQKKYDANTPRVQKMLDEYELKGAFVDAFWAVLTTEQRDHFVDPKWLHVAFVDLYCTTLMIIHTSPIITGADVVEIRTKLEQMLVKQYNIAEDQQPALGPILDTWQSDVGTILSPVKKSDVRFYTYDQGDIAARATARMVKSIRDFVTLTEEDRAKLLDDYSIYVPRVVAAE
ncbi:MAG: sigma-70 family RNA polymerase sigma factor [Planctomycetota bacterium]